MYGSNCCLPTFLQGYFVSLIYNFLYDSKEEWLSGLKRRSAKSLYRIFCIVGSNPTSSVFFK